MIAHASSAEPEAQRCMARGMQASSAEPGTQRKRAQAPRTRALGLGASFVYAAIAKARKTSSCVAGESKSTSSGGILAPPSPEGCRAKLSGRAQHRHRAPVPSAVNPVHRRVSWRSSSGAARLGVQRATRSRRHAPRRAHGLNASGATLRAAASGASARATPPTISVHPHGGCCCAGTA